MVHKESGVQECYPACTRTHKMKTADGMAGQAQRCSFILMKLDKKTNFFNLLISLFRALVNYPVIGSERDNRESFFVEYIANKSVPKAISRINRVF